MAHPKREKYWNQKWALSCGNDLQRQMKRSARGEILYKSDSLRLKDMQKAERRVKSVDFSCLFTYRKLNSEKLR